MNALETWKFDQTSYGWRILESPSLQIQSIFKYLNLNTDDSYYTLLPRYVLYWHITQCYGFLLKYEKALYYANLSFDNNHIEWNNYVKCCISFFNSELFNVPVQSLNKDIITNMRYLLLSGCNDYREI